MLYFLSVTKAITDLWWKVGDFLAILVRFDFLGQTAKARDFFRENTRRRAIFAFR